MKILLLIDSLGSGGAQRQIVTLAKMLKGKAFDVSVLCYAQEDFFVKYLEGLDISIHWELELNYLKRIFKIRSFIRKGDYNTVISFLDVPNFLNCFAAVGGKKWKVITSERSAKKELFQSMQGKIFARFQRYSDILICNSHNAKNLWLENYPQYKNKLGIIYNPVIVPDILSDYIPKKDGKLHIVVAASYQYLKNPIGLIKALALMSDSEKKQINIDWYGRIEVITNDTRAYDESVKMIEDLRLQKVIYLHGPIKDIINKMNQADFVGLFSKVE